MQEYVSLQPDRLVVLPEGIDPVVAAFTELVSVSVHALQRFDRIAHARRNMIGIWGDGNLGYITAIFCKAMFRIRSLLFLEWIMKNWLTLPLQMQRIA